MIGDAINLGVSLYGKKKNKPKLFENTPYGQYLQKISEEGVYSPKMRSSILGRGSASAMNNVNTERTRRKGRLIGMGMENSIAGQSFINEPGLNASELLANMAAGLTEKNEMSKVRAADELAQRKNQSRDAKKAYSMDFFNTLGQGLGGLMNQGGQAYQQKQKNDEQAGYTDAFSSMMDSGDLDGAELMLLRMLLMGG